MSTQMIGKEELKEILRQLRLKKDIARVKGQAKEALRRVDPKTLSAAEWKDVKQFDEIGYCSFTLK